MSHNLNYNQQTGQYSFFSVNEKAWHGLGTIVRDYPTSQEAIQYAQLNYTVEKRPLFTIDQPSHTTFNDPNADDYFDAITPDILVPDYYATVRTDTDAVLGVVGKDYQIVQNVDAFSFFDAIVGGDGIQYETAGALGKGERIFITAKLPDYIRVGDNDVIEKYLFLTTSHDGYGSITAAFTPVRVVCANTLNAALRNMSNAIKIRHTANAKERLEQAHRVMGMSNHLAGQLQDIFNQWATIKITDPDIKKLIQLAMVPNKEVLHNLQSGKGDNLSTCFNNMVDNVYSYAMSSPTQQMDTTRGTLFGAYNAVTGYFQNVRNYKTSEAKLKSLLLGGTAQLRSQATFDRCADFAKIGSQSLLMN